MRVLLMGLLAFQEPPARGSLPASSNVSAG